MADQDLKEYTITWILFGLLFVSLMLFVIGFVGNNNSNALGDQLPIFNDYSNNISTNLLVLPGDTNLNLNSSSALVSGDTNLQGQGAAATSYNLFSSGKTFWQGTQAFIALIFSGIVGQILIAVFGGIVGITFIFFIIKVIRGIFY